MITPVLILHGKLSVAISLKQAIERNARYEVHPFTTLDAAVDFLRDHPQDVVVVDTVSLDSLPETVVPLLREAQPDVLLITTPRPNDSIIQMFGINGTVDTPYRAPQVIQAIESLLSSAARPSAPAQDAGKTGMLEHIFDDSPPPAPSTLPEHGTLEDVLHQIGLEDFGYAEAADDVEATPHDPQGRAAEFRSMLDTLSPSDAAARGSSNSRSDFDALVESLRREQQPPPRSRMSDFIIRGGIDALLQDLDDSKPSETPEKPKSRFSDDSLRLHEQLAREEPPMPTFEDAGTVSDLVTGIHDKGFQKVLSILRGDEVEEESSEEIASADFDFEMESSRSSMIDMPPRPSEDYNFDDVPSAQEPPAQVVLQQTLNVEDFSIEELLDRIEQQIPGSMPLIKPLSPHVRAEAERRWREAAMGAAQGQQPPFNAPVDVPEGFFSDQTTRASKAQRFETHPELLETEWFDAAPPVRARQDTIAFTRRSEPVHAEPPANEPPEHVPAEEKLPPPPPPESLPEAIPHEVEEPAAPPVPELMQLEAGEESGWLDLHTEDFNTQFELMAAFELATPEGGETTGALYVEMPVEPEKIDRTAQLALQLTQFSLETTAEAALLIRDGEIVGRSGPMSREELGSLEAAILASWNAGRRDARVQFVNQQETGRDYLLYTCHTEEDMLLTLIFKGSTSMTDIRRQGNRLVKSLMSVPEDMLVPVTPAPVRTPAPPVAAAVDPGVLEPFSYVWLLRDPNTSIDAPVAKAISAGMQMQLSEQAWRIHDLQVNEDYVYLYAEVPSEEPAFRIVRDLKRRSAEIARVQNNAIQPDAFWADSYLIVTPGRPLDVEEIQQFINFERM